MGRLSRWLVALGVVAGIAFFIWQKTRPSPLEVVVKPVTRGVIEKTVANTRAGTVNACRRAKLSPSIGGQIARLPVHEGDQVKTGDLLLEIWNDDLIAQLNLTEREAAVAEAQARAACLSAEEAGRQAKRAQRLFRNKVDSAEQTDRTVTQAQSLQAQCEASRATELMGRARVDVARANLSRTRLVAPFNGVVAKIEGELNEYVTPSPIGVPTPPAIDLIENNCYYISAPIDEVDAAAVRVGMDSRISLDAFKDKKFTGTVRRISPYVLDVEKQARTVDVETSFARKDDFKNLLAGYSADVEIIIASRPDRLQIPTEAIIDGRKVFVFMADEQKVHEVEVTLGLANWAFTEIVTGLKEDQLVVVNVDKPGLKDGVSAMRAKESP
ncbi:efflux RND transporter periplasmic adaptor subunit [Desulfopila sp. IMCC35006]|uniref:efflux RND transporter periplasmic adaptor subunit n=1 Tax=Desulfopila sp. IMCC35006 TaxID=2569542 RepID=UPI0010ABF143|nr:efflux RND transporter periplasmic adaptor subunit [Desulfopila sp. IMCC35006]TKB27427.1 efflux RND transporter periplasmic adaptor subunit [Desulfopila sp. IMCC35006]